MSHGSSRGNQAVAFDACPACGAEFTLEVRFCPGCGAPTSVGPDAELLLDLQSATANEYEILGILGRGGMGLVFLARDLSLGRRVAIKVLPPAMLQGEATIERFRREARIAASLRHRHITTVFGLRETPRIVFFVMELVEGATLGNVIGSTGPLDLELASAVIHDAASALSYAHRRDVIHRDLKPSNILIDREGMVMITDFGVAKLTTAEGLTSTGSTVGSPKYMAPEQWSGAATRGSDQYSLGCLAYEVLVGHPPFAGESYQELVKQHLLEAATPLHLLRHDCPAALAGAVMRMLEKEEGRRFSSIDDALAAMNLQPALPDSSARRRLAMHARGHGVVLPLPRTPRSPIPVSTMSRSRGDLDSRRVVPVWAWLLGLTIAAALVGATAYLVRGPLSGEPASPTSASLPDSPAVSSVAAPREADSVPTGKVASDTARDQSPLPRAEPASVAASGSPHMAPPAPPARSAASLDVTPSDVRLPVGGQETLHIAVHDAQKRVRPAGQPVWATSDITVATVSSDGVVIAIAPGSASVTATMEGVRSKPVAVVVFEPPHPLAVLRMLVSPWADVSIDGKPKGRRSRGLDTLTTGVPHRIHFEHEGFLPVDTAVRLDAGEENLLRIQLRRAP